MPTATLLNARCSTCRKVFKNSKGLARHKQYIQRYNQRHQELDELPDNIIAEFKQILLAEIHKKLPLNFRSMGKKIVSIPCPEICLDSPSQDTSVIEEIDPLEKLLQLSKKKIRQPRFLRGEILIEWKKKVFKEINGNIYRAGYLHINFYISQSQLIKM
ncbi:hypothetical protein Glove_444g47 [Diversispora epigaea]|uniref:C2H2-type domain-containing protein n=1 Tax=Diversispora epigaea TaxID=1348612 RepID=A0A397GQX4_9GLOM|nr:hypothetical protein Glove_444g47 [Diversispora epigaea]